MAGRPPPIFEAYMKYDPDAIRVQQQQHQTVIDSLLKQRAGLDEAITKLREEIDKLEQVLQTLDSLET